MFGRLGQNGDSEACHSERMQGNTGVVQISQDLHAKGIQHGMAE